MHSSQLLPRHLSRTQTSRRRLQIAHLLLVLRIPKRSLHHPRLQSAVGLYRANPGQGRQEPDLLPAEYKRESVVGDQTRVCGSCHYIDGGDVEYGGVDYDWGGCGVGWVGIELCVEYDGEFGEFSCIPVLM